MSDDPKEILRESAWNELRHRLDVLGQTIHRTEDRDTRLAFMRLVEIAQAYEEMKRL